MLLCSNTGNRRAISGFKPLQNGAVLCWLASTRTASRGLMFQTPSERGGIVLPHRHGAGELPPLKFQTPSERGGIVLTDQIGR